MKKLWALRCEVLLGLLIGMAMIGAGYPVAPEYKDVRVTFCTDAELEEILMAAEYNQGIVDVRMRVKDETVTGATSTFTVTTYNYEWVVIKRW